ncbi:MAG: hypothetical protein JOZ60_08470 [Verrucomicrobia bacterium]|nr:hypothetical protein [Verrucomicrobiota bacterium]
MNGRKALWKLIIASSLVGLALGFLLIGILILSKAGSEGAPIVSGALGVLLGATFFTAAFSYWKHETLGS